MNRLNQKGIDLLAYKCELMKDYPKLVRDSLYLALEQMVENKIIDLSTYNSIREENTTIEAFEDYLLTKSNFIKTREEILKEFEEIRSKLNIELASLGLDTLQTESSVEKSSIDVIKKFCITEAFTMEYFGVEEKDVLKLMKRKGFIEKFAALRLVSIIKPFVENLKSRSNLFTCNYSLSYYEEDVGYAIDIYFEIPIKGFEEAENIKQICKDIAVIVEDAQNYYEEKTIP